MIIYLTPTLKTYNITNKYFKISWLTSFKLLHSWSACNSKNRKTDGYSPSSLTYSHSSSNVVPINKHCIVSHDLSVFCVDKIRINQNSKLLCPTVPVKYRLQYGVWFSFDSYANDLSGDECGKIKFIRTWFDNFWSQTIRQHVATYKHAFSTMPTFAKIVSCFRIWWITL